MRTKIAVFLSLFFLLSGAVLQDALQDAIEARAELDLGAEEDASPIEDSDIFLRSGQSGTFRNRRTRGKLSLRLRDFTVRVTDFLPTSRIKERRFFVPVSPSELYKLQHAYRI